MELNKFGAGRKPHSFLVSLPPHPPAAPPPPPPSPVYTNTHMQGAGLSESQTRPTPTPFRAMKPPISRKGVTRFLNHFPSGRDHWSSATSDPAQTRGWGAHDTNRNEKGRFLTTAPDAPQSQAQENIHGSLPSPPPARWQNRNASNFPQMGPNLPLRSSRVSGQMW